MVGGRGNIKLGMSTIYKIQHLPCIKQPDKPRWWAYSKLSILLSHQVDNRNTSISKDNFDYSLVYVCNSQNTMQDFKNNQSINVFIIPNYHDILIIPSKF